MTLCSTVADALVFASMITKLRRSRSIHHVPWMASVGLVADIRRDSTVSQNNKSITLFHPVLKAWCMEQYPIALGSWIGILPDSTGNIQEQLRTAIIHGTLNNKHL